MMKRPWMMLFLVLALLLASCSPAGPADQPAKVSVETIVAATYAVISAQTQVAEPLASSTPVYTATITETPVPPTVTPTYTPTFVFYTATPFPTITPLATNTPLVTPTPAAYECTFISHSPSNGTIMGSRHGFDWIIKVLNSGEEDWLVGDVVFVYFSGEKIHQQEQYALSENISSGGQTSLGVDMIAPKAPGSYSTTWALKRGDDIFCKHTLSIIVD